MKWLETLEDLSQSSARRMRGKTRQPWIKCFNKDLHEARKFLDKSVDRVKKVHRRQNVRRDALGGDCR